MGILLCCWKMSSRQLYKSLGTYKALCRINRFLSLHYWINFQAEVRPGIYSCRTPLFQELGRSYFGKFYRHYTLESCKDLIVHVLHNVEKWILMGGNSKQRNTRAMGRKPALWWKMCKILRTKGITLFRSFLVRPAGLWFGGNGATVISILILFRNSIECLT